MPTPIELTLSNLLPTVSFLPPELIALSTSLLAQSRSKAASLKPEEEIGRTYACCHIACQRLGHKLALEIAKPAPPVKPKVYTKLHTYLNSVLRTTTTPRTPISKRTEDKLQHGSASNSKTRAGSAQATPTKGVTTPSGKRDASATQEANSEANVSVMPLIRHLCKALDVPEAAPHVFAGVTSVLQATESNQSIAPPTKKRRTSDKSKKPEPIAVVNIPALTLALFSAVCGRMRGEEIAEDAEFFDKAVELTKDFCQKSGKPHGLVLDETTDMKHAIKEFNERFEDEWQSMEWYQNVPSLEANAGAAYDAEESEDDEESTVVKRPAKTPLRRKEKHGRSEKDDLGAAGLLPGLGTMFQPAIDWLSDERRADYAQWKKDLLRRATVIEQEA